MSSSEVVNGNPARYFATPPTLTDKQGSALMVDENGNLKIAAVLEAGDIQIGAVEIKDGTTDARATAKVDGAAAGTPTALSVGGKYNATPPTYDDGDQFTLQGDVNGRLLGSSIITSIVPGTAATSLGKAVDSAAGATDTGTAGLAVRDDALATLTPADGDYTHFRVDSTGALWVRETLAPGYEDNNNGKAIVEHRYTSFRVTADTQVKAGAGFIHAINVNPTTATPTAGLLTIYDSLTETGTILHSEWVFATSPGHSIILDVAFSTGLYIGYDATLANVSVDGSYR